MKLINTLLIALFSISNTNATNPDSVAILLSKADERLAVLKSGTVNYLYKIKPILANKTYVQHINLSYDKNAGGNSLSPFVMMTNNYPTMIDAYPVLIGLDSKIYKADTTNKLVYIHSPDTINYTSYKQLVSKFAFRLFKPFISKGAGILSEYQSRYTYSRTSTTTYNNVLSNKLVLSRLDTLHPEFGYDSLILYLSAKDYSLLKYENVIYDSAYGNAQRLQIDSITYSESKIDADLYLDNLLAYGYATIDIDPYKKEDIESKFKPGDIVHDWIAYNKEDETIKLSDISAGLILFDFSYLACHACLQSVAMLNNLRNRFTTEELAICWINPFDYEKKEFMFKQLEKKNVSFPIYFDKNKEIINEYGITVYPYLFLVDKTNLKLIDSYIGYASEHENQISEAIERAIHK